MKTRREFLKKAGLAVAAGVIAPQLLASLGGAIGNRANAASNVSKNIGLQLYSLRDMVKDQGIAEVLKTVAQMGYKNLETASYDDGKVYGLDAKEVKKMAEDLGMRITSCHIGQSYSPDKRDEIMAWWDKAIETNQQLGVKYIIQPWMSVKDNSTLDHIKMYCDYFSEVGEKVAKAGMQFGYHNHDFEFKKINDQIIFDYMLQNVDKKNVVFELDVYWVMRGGHNPVDYMKNYPSQIRVLHIKDEKEIGASGLMDFKSIFEQAYAIDINDWYVEVERYSSDSPVNSVKQSFDYLYQADYVR